LVPIITFRIVFAASWLLLVLALSTITAIRCACDSVVTVCDAITAIGVVVGREGTLQIVAYVIGTGVCIIACVVGQATVRDRARRAGVVGTCFGRT